MLDRDADQLFVLVEIDRRRLAGGAHDDDAVCPLGHMPVDQAAESHEIDRAVVLHRGYDGYQASGDHGMLLPYRLKTATEVF